MVDVVWPIQYVPRDLKPKLTSATTTFANPYNGVRQFLERDSARWVFEMAFPPFNDDWIRDMEGLIISLRGPVNKVLMPIYHARLPRGSLAGNPYLAESLSARKLKLTGCTPNATGILKRGDFVQTSYGRAHIVTQDVTANGSGVAEVIIEPRLREPIVPGALSDLTSDVRILMNLITDDGFEESITPPRIAAINLKFEENLGVTSYEIAEDDPSIPYGGGVAQKALKLFTPRKIEITGAVTGEATFDGSADVVIDTVAPGGSGGGGLAGLVVLRRANNQNISNVTWTEVIWDTEDIDTLGAWSATTPSRIVVPSGVSLAKVTVYLSWVNFSSGTRWGSVWLGTSTEIHGTHVGGDVRYGVYETLTTIVTRWFPVTAGQHITVEVHQLTGGTRALYGMPSSGNFGGNSSVQVEFLE